MCAISPFPLRKHPYALWVCVLAEGCQKNKTGVCAREVVLQLYTSIFNSRFLKTLFLYLTTRFLFLIIRVFAAWDWFTVSFCRSCEGFPPLFMAYGDTECWSALFATVCVWIILFFVVMLPWDTKYYYLFILFFIRVIKIFDQIKWLNIFICFPFEVNQIPWHITS